MTLVSVREKSVNMTTKILKHNNNMVKIKTFLKRPNGSVVCLEKQVDFIPSKGLIIYEPIYGTIGVVVYDKNGYTATMDSVIEPTDDSSEKHMKEIGFVEVKI